MKRPHPLALLLCLALVATLVWLNMQNGYNGGRSTWNIGEGWPLHWLVPGHGLSVDHFSIGPTEMFLNLLAWLALVGLPTLTLHKLLRRTLHIHLATACVLMLASAAILAANLTPRTKVWHSRFEFQTFGWPESFYIDHDFTTDSNRLILAANILTALALLCAVALLSEKFLWRRRNTSGGPAGPPNP